MPHFTGGARTPALRTLAAVLFLAAGDDGSVSSARAGVLDDVSNEVRTPKHSDTSDSSDSDEDKRKKRDCNHGGGWGYYDSGSNSSNTTSGSSFRGNYFDLSFRDDMFAPFPYAEGTPGIVVPTGWQNTSPYPFSARIAFEYGDDFDRLGRFAGTGMVESAAGWGLDASGHVYVEQVEPNQTNDLFIGDINVLYRCFQTERFHLRAGVGMNYFEDTIDNTSGVNFTLRSDYFPIKPLILCGEVEGGTLGHTSTFHTRASIGFSIQQAEFFTGYDYRSIGSVHIEGPILGVQFWY